MTIKEVMLDGPDVYLVTSDDRMHWLDGCDEQGIALDNEMEPAFFGITSDEDSSTELRQEIAQLRVLGGAHYDEWSTWFPREVLLPYLRETASNA